LEVILAIRTSYFVYLEKYTKLVNEFHCTYVWTRVRFPPSPP